MSAVYYSAAGARKGFVFESDLSKLGDNVLFESAARFLVRKCRFRRFKIDIYKIPFFFRKFQRHICGIDIVLIDK